MVLCITTHEIQNASSFGHAKNATYCRKRISQKRLATMPRLRKCVQLLKVNSFGGQLMRTLLEQCGVAKCAKLKLLELEFGERFVQDQG